MTGFEKAKEIANNIKAETAVRQESKVAMAQAGASELAAIKANPELSSFYTENVSVGADNLSGQVPVLKVYAAGKSNYTLGDGTKPKDGYFFYSPTKKEYKSLDTHILSISKGFQAPGMPDKNGKTELKFNQLVGGVFVDDGEYLPFIIYLTGSKLSNMWKFGKEAAVYKAQGIPMFCLSVNLNTVEAQNNFGYSWLINFDIVKDSEGNPTLSHDLAELTFLKETVTMLEDMMKSIINAKAGEQVQELKDEQVVSVIGEEEQKQAVHGEVDVDLDKPEGNPDPLPFETDENPDDPEL